MAPEPAEVATQKMPKSYTPGDEQRHLLVSWVHHCHAAGLSPELCISSEARQLLKAIRESVRAGGPTNVLGRAARGWGAGFSAPAAVLTYLSPLRAVLSEPGIGAPGWQGDWLPVSQDLLTRIFDQLMREAVDAAAASLRAAARTDALTGCANRLAFNEDLARAAASAREAGLDLAVAMVDLDGLKLINDSEGHEAGDVALVSLTTTLRQMLRAADSLYRIGGDEFVVLAPFTDAEGAEAMLRRASERPGPAFSWGVASIGTVGAAAFEQPELLLSSADAALYAARGRRPDASRPERLRRRTAGELWSGTLRRVGTATGVATAAAVLLAVVSALGIALSLEGQSTPKGFSAITAPPATSPYLPAAKPGSSTTSGSIRHHNPARHSTGASTRSSDGHTPSVATSSGGASSDDAGSGASHPTGSSAGGHRTTPAGATSRPGNGSRPSSGGGSAGSGTGSSGNLTAVVLPGGQATTGAGALAGARPGGTTLGTVTSGTVATSTLAPPTSLARPKKGHSSSAHGQPVAPVQGQRYGHLLRQRRNIIARIEHMAAVIAARLWHEASSTGLHGRRPHSPGSAAHAARAYRHAARVHPTGHSYGRGSNRSAH